MTTAMTDTSKIPEYQAKDVESKWQNIWDEQKLYKFAEDSSKENYYSLVMFPYPSGDLHMGHMRVYTISDVISRHRRMLGFNVLNPMGFDAFGLPAENAAISRNIHPGEWTESNVKNMRAQLKRMGTSYDWDREVVSCRSDYYKWTQYIFLKLYEKGLAYQKEAPVNWCPECQTVLANEQVEDGKCWRHTDTDVERKMMKQWFLKITAYAEELLQDLDKLTDWPENVKTMQRNWIGKSLGAELHFPLWDDEKQSISVFTTRPDTVMGITYLVLAPEHKSVMDLTTDEHKEEVAAYIKEASKKSEIERTAEHRKKTGVFTGSYLKNPFNGDKIPVWVADYALVDYGTGAVMAVPAHDQRDYEFAQEFDLPLKPVIIPEKIYKALEAKGHNMHKEEITFEMLYKEEYLEGAAYSEPGLLVNSSSAETGADFNSIDNESAKAKVVEWGQTHEANGASKIAESKVTYRLRDWLVSRQRYWGTPIPLYYEAKDQNALDSKKTKHVSEHDLINDFDIKPVAYENLPVELPTEIKFSNEGGSILKQLPEWYESQEPQSGKKVIKETDTLDTFLCSSWYFMRYCDPHNLETPFGKDKTFAVHQYVGGIEHAILHLLYARFFTKALRDCDMLNFDEPFTSLLSQGMVTKFSEKDGKVVKMSKSKGNVVGIDDFFDKFGADAARMFILFAAPPEAEVEWSEEGAQGQHRFVGRIWRLYHQLADCISKLDSNDKPDFDMSKLSNSNQTILKGFHSALKSVSEDLDPKRYSFNTSISRMTEFINSMYKYVLAKTENQEEYSEEDKQVISHVLVNFLKMLAPFAPHLSEELWQTFITQDSNKDSVHNQHWPKYKEEYTQSNTINLVIQFKGKKVDVLEIAKDTSKEELEKTALANPKMQKRIEGLEIKKVIVVPNKLVNVVAV